MEHGAMAIKMLAIVGKVEQISTAGNRCEGKTVALQKSRQIMRHTGGNRSATHFTMVLHVFPNK